MSARMVRRTLAAVIALAIVLGGSAVAWAFWTATDSSNPGRSAADTLPVGQTPTASLSTPGGVETATITFNRLATTGGQTVPAFLIKRYSTASGGTASATFTCTPATGSPVSCTESAVPAGTWYYTDTPTVAGSNWVGAESARSAAVTTDTTAPTVTYAQDPAKNINGYNNTAVTVTLTATDEIGGSGVARISYKVDSAATVQVNAASATFPVSGDGTHTVAFTATDHAGNTSATQTQTILIDSTPPGTPAITSKPTSINAANKTSITIAGTAEAGSSVTLALTDGVPAHTITTSAPATGGNWSCGLNPSGLNDGTLSVSVTATDLAGNTSTPAAQTTITKDTVSPTVSNVSSTKADGSYGVGAVIPVTVTFSEAVVVTGTPQLTLATGTPATTAINYVSGSGSTTLTFNYTVAAGNISSHLDYATATALSLHAGTITDAVGNNATLTLAAPSTAGSLSANTNLVIDTTAPTISSAALAGASPTNASSVSWTVTFSESVTGVDMTDFSLTSTGLGGTHVVTAVTGSGAVYTVTASTGTGSGTLRLNVLNDGSIKDTAGNALIGTANGGTYTIDRTPPAAPSTPDLTAASDSGASSTDDLTNVTTPTFTGTAEVGSTVTIYDGSTPVGTGTATSGTYTITTSALSDGSHSITAKAVDAAGNVSSPSSALTVTIDTIAPAAPTNVAYNDGNNGQGDKVTGTAEANSAVTVTQTAGPHVGATWSTTSTSGTFTVSVDNISQSKATVSVSYSVVATDAAGNVSAATTLGPIADSN